VLGGLRVTELKDEIGIFHATLAQLFFVLVCAMALFTSRWWRNVPKMAIYDGRALRYLYWLATAMVLFQLILGATMRHQHAGLAIPDFPRAYGKVWPRMDAEAVAYYNQIRLETTALQPITAVHVGLQMAHRLCALFVFATIVGAAVWTRRQFGWGAALTKLSMVWAGLVFSQVALGAATIWTNKSADVATAHVAVGALTLMVGALLSLAAHRCLEASSEAQATVRSVQTSPLQEMKLPA
jgi:cytochrome c oxidase assembly protein subunit 15